MVTQTVGWLAAPAQVLTVATVPPADPKVTLDPVESTILAQRKRIMGKKRSLEMVQRVATEIGPIVRRTLESPSLQGDLQALAGEAGMSLADYTRYFAGKQEGDLLLESGGDPNARSSAKSRK